MDGPSVLAQFTVAAVALIVAVGTFAATHFKDRRERLRRRETIQKALKSELAYLVALYEEAYGFWENKDNRYADHMVDRYIISLPPLLASPQIWMDTSNPEDIEKITKLIAEVYSTTKRSTSFLGSRATSAKSEIVREFSRDSEK